MSFTLVATLCSQLTFTPLLRALALPLSTCFAHLPLPLPLLFSSSICFYAFLRGTLSVTLCVTLRLTLTLTLTLTASVPSTLDDFVPRFAHSIDARAPNEAEVAILLGLLSHIGTRRNPTLLRLVQRISEVLLLLGLFITLPCSNVFVGRSVMIDCS